MAARGNESQRMNRRESRHALRFRYRPVFGRTISSDAADQPIGALALVAFLITNVPSPGSRSRGELAGSTIVRPRQNVDLEATEGDHEVALRCGEREGIGDRRGGSPRGGLLGDLRAFAERDLERLRRALAIDRDRYYIARLALE